MNSHQRRTWRRYLLRHLDVAQAIEHKRIMRMYRHAFVMLEPTRARWSPWHALLSWWHLRPLKSWAWKVSVSMMLCACILPGLHAEPKNAPDVKGKFTLVVSSTVRQPMGERSECATDWCREHSGLPPDGFYRVFVQQPLVVIPGFDSFYRCRAAGMELQARFNTDGYTLDFVCALTGK